MGSTNFTSLSVNGVPVLGGSIPTVTGNVFWVDSGNPLATTATPGTFNLPLSTIDAAIGKCTANNGDLILVKEGHTETLTTAGATALDVAGVTVLGLGVGNNRPVITFGSSDNSATFTMSGNNTKLLNIVFVCNDDGLTNGLVVSGDNCTVDIETQDTSSAVEFETAVRLDTANNCYLKLKHNGFTAGNAVVRLVAIDDCDNVTIDIDAYGVVSTAWVNMVDVASTNVLVNGKLYTQGVTNGSRDIVDTITGSTWFGTIYDMSAGKQYSGGSGQAWATTDVTGLAAAIDAIDNFVDTEVASILTASGAVADAALADTIEGAAATTQSMITDIKGVLQRIGADNANNTAATTLVADNRDGSVLERLESIIATLRDDVASNFVGVDDADNVAATTNVVPNHDGSILERLEALATDRMGSSLSFNNPNYFVVTADMTSATWNTQATHEIATVTGMVRMCIIPQVTSTLTDAADGASIQLGIEGSTSAIIGSTGAAGAGGNTLSANEFWVDTSPADVICTEANLGALTFTVGGGLDVGYEITGAALTGGTILFHVWWIKQDSTGAVVAGTGAAL